MPLAEVSIGASMIWRRRPFTPAPPAATRRFVLPVFATGTIGQGGGTEAFVSLGYLSSFWTNSEVMVQTRTPIDVTVTSWTVQLNEPLPEGESLTFRLVVDGTASVTLPIQMIGNGADTGARSTTGALQIPAGSTVSIRGTAVGGTAEERPIRGFMLACSATKALVAVRSPGSEIAAQRWAWSGAGGNGGSAANFAGNSNQDWWLNPLPGVVTFEQLTVQAVNHTASDTENIQPRVGGSSAGPAVALTAGNDTVTGAVSAPVPRAAIAADLSTHYSDVLIDALPNGEETPILSMMSAYSVADPYADFCVLYSGKGGNILAALGSTSSRVAARVMPGGKDNSYGETLDDPALSLGQYNLRWPNLPGTIRHFMATVLTGNSVTTPYTITSVFRKNDADEISVTSATVDANTPQVLIDDDTEVPVVADDLVCFGSFASANNNFNSGSGVAYGIGFVAD